MEENRAVVLHRPGMTVVQALNALYSRRDCEIFVYGMWRTGYLTHVCQRSDESLHEVMVVCPELRDRITLKGAQEISVRLRLVADGTLAPAPILLEERVSDG